MIKLIKGFHDILPDESIKWRHIIKSAKIVLDRFGFREIITPVMEKTELFVRGIGQATDIIEKEMYTFEDKGGEYLSLRPEATAGVLRAVVEQSLLRREPLLKLYTIGPMFRRERPSKGRFRQFFQINAEVLGDDSPYIDAEVISAAYAIMTEVGALGLMMEINSVGCAECRPVYRQHLRNYFSKYMDGLCSDCQRRYTTNPLRILDCKVPDCVQIGKKAPLVTDSLDESCKDHFNEVQETLELLNIPFNVEPRMVRGLEYYTRTAFEIVHDDLGKSKAVGGGGRYDRLLRELGGPDQSGIGFGIGIERLAMGLPDEGRYSRSIDYYIACITDSGRDLAIKLTNDLRTAGYSADMRYTTTSLKSQMKTADKLGAIKVIMIGEEELANCEVTIRDMESKEQVSVPIDELINRLQGDEA